MSDTDNDPRDETTIAIKGALDREVARRFDAERSATEHARAIEVTRAGVRGRRLDDGARKGPFARVPVPLQWVGLAAAIVAALAGIRSFYRDQTAARPAAVQADASVTPPGAPTPDTTAEPAAPAAPTITVPEAPTASEPVRAPHREPEPAIEPRPRRGEAPLRAEVPSPPPEPPPSPRGVEADAGVVAGGAYPTIRGEATAKEKSATAPAPPASPMIATGALSAAPEPVRVASDRLLQQGLFAEVRSVPQLQATLVTIRTTGRRGAARSDTGPTSETRLLAERNREETRRGTSGRSSAVDRDREGSPREDRRATGSGDFPGFEADDAPGGASGSAGSRGAYYVRAFVGAAFDQLSPESQGCLGTGTRAIALRADESWGNSVHEVGLRRIFGLRSLIAVDGVHLPEASKGGPASGKLLAAAARKVYEIDVRGEPVVDSADEHRLTLSLLRRFPDDFKGPAAARGMEIPVVVRNGAMAVVVVPDAYFSGVDPEPSPRGALLFVAVSPRFADIAPTSKLAPIPREAEWSDPAMVIERIEPRYPEDARALGVHGEVVLEATVLRDGTVDHLHVVSMPSQKGAELLIEPAASAVRRWRFLPARLRGERVDSIVTVSLSFRLE